MLGLIDQVLYHMMSVDRAGLVLFVPWHLARGKKLKLDEIIPYQILADAPPHLTDWLTKHEESLGSVRRRIMFYLFIYISTLNWR
jgi:hypothetical protein